MYHAHSWGKKPYSALPSTIISVVQDGNGKWKNPMQSARWPSLSAPYQLRIRILTTKRTSFSNIYQLNPSLELETICHRTPTQCFILLLNVWTSCYPMHTSKSTPNKLAWKHELSVYQNAPTCNDLFDAFDMPVSLARNLLLIVIWICIAWSLNYW